MESVDVLYERIDHIIAISSGKFHNTLSVEPTKVLNIAYSDYVKSQLHLNIVTDLFNRSVIQYKKANDFLNGDVRFKKSALKVLEYFYEDIINFLKYNKYNIKLTLCVDESVTSKTQQCDYDEIKRGLIELSERDFKSFEGALDFLDTHTNLQKVIDYISAKDKIKQKLDSYCVIAILLNRKIGKNLIWEVQ